MPVNYCAECNVEIITDKSMCTECIDKEINITRISKIAYENNLIDTRWCLEESTDFSANHGFTATKIDAGCTGESCFIQSTYGANPVKLTPLNGDTWLDVWKSIDNFCKQKVCSHRLIEEITQDGDTLIAHCGS